MFQLTVYSFFVIFSLCKTQALEDVIANSTAQVSGISINETGNSSTNVSTELSIDRKIQISEGLIDTKNLSTKEFRPSPQLETIYEYNKDPVVPVMGEAKTVSQANARTFFWPLNDNKQPSPPATAEPPWTQRVIFPQTTAETTRDQPYPFVTSNTAYPSQHFDNRPSRIPPTVSYGTPSSDNPRGYANPTKWDQFGNSGIGSNYNKGPAIMHKTHYESYGPPIESTSSSIATSVSPIKKIIGLLAAFIPLGLLISALTPSVIQVVPMNTTQSRSRSDIQTTSTKRLVSTLHNLDKIEDNGCEERILCELLLSAGASKNAEEHVENLLQTFTEQERDAVQKAEELQRIYGAVKRQNCKLLACSDIEKNQKRKKKLKDKS